MVKVDPEVRCESFCEVCESYGDEAAVEEAARCLRCCWPMEPVKGPPRVPKKVVEVPPVATSPEEKQFY
jgi:hypothetical protein